VRIRQVVQQHLTVADEKRTNEFLSAASRGDMQRVRAMLQQHFDPDAADYDGGCCMLQGGSPLVMPAGVACDMMLSCALPRGAQAAPRCTSPAPRARQTWWR
jgi:hypothetical protein